MLFSMFLVCMSCCREKVSMENCRMFMRACCSVCMGMGRMKMQRGEQEQRRQEEKKYPSPLRA
jgi:hypothetical protein